MLSVCVVLGLKVSCSAVKTHFAYALGRKESWKAEGRTLHKVRIHSQFKWVMCGILCGVCSAEKVLGKDRGNHCRPVVGTGLWCHSGVHISGRTELRESVRKGHQTGVGVVTAAV